MDIAIAVTMNKRCSWSELPEDITKYPWVILEWDGPAQSQDEIKRCVSSMVWYLEADMAELPGCTYGDLVDIIAVIAASEPEVHDITIDHMRIS